MKQAREYQLEEYTFGDSEAEKTLARILSQYSSSTLNSFVTKLLESISIHGRNIDIKDNTVPTKKLLFEALRCHYYQKIEDSKIIIAFPEVESYLKNAAIKRLRIFFTRKESRQRLIMTEEEKKELAKLLYDYFKFPHWSMRYEIFEWVERLLNENRVRQS